tara:strand:- start:166 stop:402 length:237 start_codon:yes stop_codon:yes gene_type:complete
MTPKEQAQEGLNLLKESILKTIENNPGGVSNIDVARELDIESDYQGAQKNYLSWSILGLLLNEEKVKRVDQLYYPKGE